MSFDMQEACAARFQAGFSSSASGVQHNNLGSGNQYNNPGSGSQYNADNINFFNQEKDLFLADLRVTDPRSDKIRIERTKGNLLKDSYSWILDNKDFRQWLSEKRLLWIKGSPGKGKTMLLCGVIDELQAMGYKSTFFFFCQATDARLNNATSVLRGLLYLILDQNPHLLKLVREKYDKAGAGIFKDVNSWDVLCQMLISTVSHESLRNVILVIDGLDECTSQLDQLIRFIIELTSHAKIIVSSRLWLSIDRGLATAFDNMKIYLSLELNEDVISVAVNAYINYKVNQLVVLKGLEDEMRNKIRDYLVTKANSTFLWVSLVYEQLADNRVARRHTWRKLNEFPPGLDALYHRILTQIFQLPDAKHCREVLAVMSIVSRPLDLEELASILHRLNFIGDIVEECGSLLTVREGAIYFIHQSAKDFLLRHTDTIMPLGVAHNHRFVLSRLLQSMSDTLQRNIYHLTSHGTPVEEIHAPNPDPLKPVRYACVYWADHFICENAEPTQIEEVCSFIAEHFLHWLESLSLLRSMSEGILSMSRVQRIAEVLDERLEEKTLVRDALRFIRYFRVPIEVDPMQVYLSALVFSPLNSFIRELFSDEQPKWPSMPVVEEDWSLCVQTLEGHEHKVMSIAFSGDDSKLASACLNGTVKLWDKATGQCLRTLSTSGEGRSVALSADGFMLATVSDAFIELRNTVTGNCERRLHTRGSPLSVAFSSDGDLLASGSDHGVVQLWDTNVEQHSETLRGHLSLVNSVVFSGNGSLIASASEDRTARLWQTDTGFCITTIQYDRPVRSVALSHDACRIVSAFDKGSMVYGLTTPPGIIDHDALSKARGVAITRDGTTVAFGLEAAAVQIQDLPPKALILFEPSSHVGHHGPVTSVAFSQNGGLLASASFDTTIKLWDLTMKESNHKQAETTRRSSRLIRALGAKVISDAAGSNGRINSLSLTKDGTYLIVISSMATKVFSVETGQLIHELNGGASCGSSGTIRKGHVHIAETFGNQIRIIDQTTGRLLRTLEIQGGEENRMVISHKDTADLAYPQRRLVVDGSGITYVEDGVGPPELWVTSIRFSVSGYQLHTNFGTIDLETMAISDVIPLKPSVIDEPDPTVEGYHLQKGGSWIVKDGRRFLWLPPEYRSDMTAICGSTVATGYNSGEVLFMRFS